MDKICYTCYNCIAILSTLDMGVVEDLSEVNLESSLPKNPDALVAAEALGPLILPEWLKIDHHPKVNRIE